MNAPLWSQVKSGALVAFLTALVWLMAEGESLRTEKVRTDLRFRTKAESGRMVRVDAGQEFSGSVLVTLEGPTVAVDSLASRARAPIDLEPGMEGVPAEPGRHTVNLAEALRGQAPFKDSSVSIIAVEPASATVWVDSVESRSVTVKVEVPEGVVLEAQPVAAPAAVTVRMPESVARAAGEFQATARLAPEMLANVPAGTRAALRVPVTLPEAVPRDREVVRVTPAEVMVSVVLRSRVASTVVQAVPVYLRIAPGELDSWDIEIAPEGRVLGDVTVSGPAEAVDQVKSGKIKVVGYLALSTEDLERAGAAGGPLEKEVLFSDVPTPLRFEAKQKTVKLTVRRREMGPPVGR